jgi:CBS domain-containing protein
MLPKPISAELPIRVRRILSGDGRTTETKTVRCERRQRSVPLAKCLGCQYCDCVLRDGTKLVCDWPRARPPANDALDSLARQVFPQVAHQTRVREVMSPRVVCVRPDVSVETVTELLLHKGFSGVPVVDAEGFPVGVISQTDLVREQHDRGDTFEEILEPGLHEETLARATVGEVMMPIAFTVEEGASLADAATLMVVEGVHRVPVVSEDGRVVGILSALDVARWVATA